MLPQMTKLLQHKFQQTEPIIVGTINFLNYKNNEKNHYQIFTFPSIIPPLIGGSPAIVTIASSAKTAVKRLPSFVMNKKYALSNFKTFFILQFQQRHALNYKENSKKNQKRIDY